MAVVSSAAAAATARAIFNMWKSSLGLDLAVQRARALRVPPGQSREDGKISTGQAKAGDVHWYEAGTHEVENIDKTATRMFMVEIKDANWKPSTG